MGIEKIFQPPGVGAAVGAAQGGIEEAKRRSAEERRKREEEEAARLAREKELAPLRKALGEQVSFLGKRFQTNTLTSGLGRGLF